MKDKIRIDKDEYEAYQKLIKKLNKEYTDYKLNFKKSILDPLLTLDKADVKEKTKETVIELTKQKAIESLAKINSPFKEEKIREAVRDYKNVSRQLVWNKQRLKLMEKEADNTIYDRDGKILYDWELLFLIEQLTDKLISLSEELTLYGVNHGTL